MCVQNAELQIKYVVLIHFLSEEAERSSGINWLVWFLDRGKRHLRRQRDQISGRKWRHHLWRQSAVVGDIRTWNTTIMDSWQGRLCENVLVWRISAFYLHQCATLCLPTRLSVVTLLKTGYNVDEVTKTKLKIWNWLLQSLRGHVWTQDLLWFSLMPFWLYICL